MEKILKNPTASDITIPDVGEVIIPASGQKTIDPINYLFFARSQDTVDLLNASSPDPRLIMNDGTQDLSPAVGIIHLVTGLRTVQATLDDESPSLLINKLEAGPNVTIAQSGPATNRKVKITGTQASGYLAFGLDSDVDLPEGLLEAVGGSKLGYLQPEDRKIKAVSAITDAANSHTYRILKNGSAISAANLVFSSQSSKKITGLSETISADDVLTADFQLANNGEDINNPYTPDSDTLLLAKYDTELDADARIINSSTILKGLTGRVNGATLGVTGKFNKAADFDGSNDWIEVLHNDEMNRQELTWECWFKADTTSGDDCIFSKDGTGNMTGGHFMIQRTGNDLYYRSQSVSDGIYGTIDVNMSSDTWYHVAVVFGADGFKVFFNGNRVFQDLTWTDGWNGNRQPIAIGALNWSSSQWLNNSLTNYWDGKICEMRISKTRRYENATYTIPTAKFTKDSDTIALWHFDETSGSVIFDDSDTIHDPMNQATTSSNPEFKSDVKKFGAQSLKWNSSANDWSRLIHHDDFEVSEVTVESWLRMFSTSYSGMIFQKGSSSEEGGLQVLFDSSNNRLKVTYWGQGGVSKVLYTANNSILADTWNHFSVTFDDSEIKLYLNGNPVDTESLDSNYSNVWSNNKKDIYLAKESGGSFFSRMYLDETRVSKTVRTYQESSGIKEVVMMVVLGD